MKKFFKSFQYALSGLKTVWKEEHNFRLEIIIGILVFICAFVFNFSFYEWVAIVIACILVLSAEIINTAIEDLSDMVESEQNPLIGKIKDTMAGMVLISSFGSVILGILIFINHFIK